jgi:hypothetical protein
MTGTADLSRQHKIPWLAFVASEMVRLDPADCFALATYKIASAMKNKAGGFLFLRSSAYRISRGSLSDAIFRARQPWRSSTKLPKEDRADIEDAVVQNLVARIIRYFTELWSRF